jgi:hypothetical protein
MAAAAHRRATEGERPYLTFRQTDSIDGETLLRTLMAWARGERWSVPWFARRARKKRIAGA